MIRLNKLLLFLKRLCCFPNRFVQRVRNEGLFLYFQSIIIFLFLEREFLISLSLNVPIQDIEPRMPFLIKKASWNDLEKFREEKYSDSENDFREWLRNGYDFIIALNGKNVVSYATARPCDQLLIAKFNDKRLEKSLVAEGYRAYTLLEYRGKRIYPALAIAVLRSLKEKGYEKVVGSVDAYNYSARIAHQRTGYKEVALVTKLKFFGFVLRTSINKI